MHNILIQLDSYAHITLLPIHVPCMQTHMPHTYNRHPSVLCNSEAISNVDTSVAAGNSAANSQICANSHSPSGYLLSELRALCETSHAPECESSSWINCELECFSSQVSRLSERSTNAGSSGCSGRSGLEEPNGPGGGKEEIPLNS